MCAPNPESSSHLPPHHIPLDCPRALALGTLLHAANWHGASVLCMVIYIRFNAILSNNPTLFFLALRRCSNVANPQQPNKKPVLHLLNKNIKNLDQ